MTKKLKIVQMNSVLFKGDAISNIMCKLDTIHRSKGWPSDIVADLFSEVEGIHTLAGNDYAYDPLIVGLSYLFSRFIRLSNKMHWLQLYREAKKQYKPNAAKSLIEGADIRVWHYGGFYTLFRQFHDGDILYFHGITPSYLSFYGESSILSKIMLQAILDLHPFVIADSQYDKSSLVNLGFKPKAIHVLPLFHSYKLECRTAQHKQPNLITWGRYALNKGIPELVAECNRAKLPLRVFGDTTQLKEYQDQYRKAIKSNAQGYALLSGKVEDFEAELAKANIYICNSYHEGFNMPAIEAMAHSMPILLRRGTAMDELITNGREGYLYSDISEVPALAERIMKNYRAMSYGAWKRSQDYSLQKYKERYLSIIRKYLRC